MKRNPKSPKSVGENKISILTRSSVSARSSRNTSLVDFEIENLSKEVKLFSDQVQSVFEKISLESNNFQLMEFTVSAEISAEGKLSILGTGVEAGSKAGITFKFARKP